MQFEYSDDFGIRDEIAVTGADGRFEASVFPGRYFLRVDEKGFGFWATNLEVPGQPVEIVLTPTRNVTFIAVGPDELPVRWLEISGKVESRGRQGLVSERGEYEVEVQEIETELGLRNWRFEAKTVELQWPAQGPLDLGILRFRAAK